MNHIVTLIAPHGSALLSADAVQAISQHLPNAPAPQWLAAETACDFTVEDSTPDTIRGAIRGVLGQRPVDCAIQPPKDRRKRLLIADMDSTIIDQECIDELAAALGIKDRISAITERAMRGEIDFSLALRERVALLKGLERRALAEVFENQITIRPGARTLVQTMRANGAHTALVSGGFSFFTQRVAEAVGFNEDQANTLIFDGDLLAGTVGEPILGREAKRDALNAFVEQLDITAAQTLAVGDGANDLDMIGAAGLGVAFRAKPAVAEAADARIDHCDLTALLYIQGYRDTEFVG